jgi:DNA-binding XRE family transcriptional regulator
MRIAKGLTQRGLAEALGHSTRSVQNLEAGVYAPSARAWNRLRELLGQDLPVP